MRFVLIPVLVLLILFPSVSAGAAGFPQATISQPTTLRDREVNACSALCVMRNIWGAQREYAKVVGKGNFAPSMDLLGDEEKGIGFLDASLVNMPKIPRFGYALSAMTVQPATAQSPAKFSIVAYPVIQSGPNQTGDDCFYIDETFVIRHSGSATVFPTAQSEVVPDDLFKTGDWNDLIEEGMKRWEQQMRPSAEKQ
ncbi:MAG TPA: hypothetical protein PLB18_11445 [Acidobacteriota bacterium]|nr:hypothetical protein [Acidobacteriota bacterium]